ncbi:SCP2 sterol-binding domain-containing protein [Streptomyces purpurogeneiscleroticus]|uniref:SCP2 sterol-binding domain-containing protein n=1 Tax=Streptomyces purpurogeneiscleroticus TaxID=68259 RepID=UPI001CC1392C|nr:SCP2 sterol-binding domain-containing protein [Streptomyces purpurogeneiscleroticus]MBZ4016046.1 hypothetical protein [Streptomyces purpurogeneiscleroticus]
MTSPTAATPSATPPGQVGNLQFLTEEYFRHFAALAEALPRIERANVDVHYAVHQAPGGDIDYSLRIRSGRVARIGLGALKRPNLRISVHYEDLRDLHTGRQHPAAAFMKGVMKVAGDRAALMDLMLVLQTAQYQQLMARLAQETNHG